jgi:hypothetical protein
VNKSGKGQYAKGHSGNPSGRPKGSRDRATLIADELFDKALFGPDKKAEAIIAKAVAMAESGDTTCMRLCFERIAPARKDRPVHFELPPMCEAKDAVDASAAIVAAVATGQLTPSEAAELSKMVESYTRVLQAADFEIRLAKVEKEVDHGRQHHR